MGEVLGDAARVLDLVLVSSLAAQGGGGAADTGLVRRTVSVVERTGLVAVAGRDSQDHWGGLNTGILTEFDSKVLLWISVERLPRVARTRCEKADILSWTGDTGHHSVGLCVYISFPF